MNPLAALAATAWVIAWCFGLGGLLRLSGRIRARRSTRFARQIALTDRIHLELGAVAAPEVRRAGLGGWAVSIAVPLEREATVGAVVRIANELFSRLDQTEAPRLTIVLRPQTPRSAPRPLRSLTLGEAGHRLAHAAGQALEGPR